MSNLPERVLDWTETYCESLTENYKQHSVRMYESSDSDYSKQCLENVKNGKQICCPECREWATVYHFSWSALGCQSCNYIVNKEDWIVEKTV